MKILLLTALFAAIVYGHLSNDNLENQTQWPWLVNKLYRYDIQSHNLAQLPEGATSGNAFQASLVIRVKANGQLLARLENPQHAQFHQEVPRIQRSVPEDLKFEAVKNLDMIFEIKHQNGRIMAMTMPSTLSFAHENLLKGLISTLQVDLSTYRTAHSAKNNYDQETQQGQFRKMETDVTGECETLYTVSPAASEWRRELTISVSEDPNMITKSRDFGHCHHRVSYHFGVPNVAEWTGTADKTQKEQFIDRAANSRILVGKEGPIYKAETTNTVFVHPYVYGQQKAEVLSYMKLSLVAFEQDNEPAWEVIKGTRVIPSLLYSITSKQMPVRDMSEESDEDVQVHSSRHANRLKKVMSIGKNMLWRNLDNEDDSSSDSTSAYVNEETLNINEPAYAALYMNPQTHKAYKQNPVNAQKLVQELAQLLQRASNMSKSDFLSKFNILVRVIAAMDSEQLTQTSQSIEVANSSKNVVKADMWMIYRDAVAQAGTLPAFKQIVSWVQSKQIRGEEAAQVVATLANTLRYPTKSVMMQFFELAMNPEVAKEQFLNSTILIAATKFINMGQVNNVTAHSFYPTHMYGRLARKHDNFVVEEILPYLRQGLAMAIQQHDSRNAQVYIKAIGNLGHRSILEVFAVYLEGKIPVSTYLRALMVDNLAILAHEKDSYTRAVLYSILRNSAEPYEVRLAAIQNIFVAHPTTSMMQAMAQMTHDDVSVQVRAAIKSAIKSAAEQQNPHHFELARTAQAARPMLTKEMFGQQYSSKLYSDYFNSEYELGIIGDFSTMGSEDSIVPKYLRYNRKSQTNGWDSISASVSNAHGLIEMFQQQMNGMWQESSGKQPDHKFSASKISEMLNIKRTPQSPLEAAFYIGLWNQQRYFTFSEQDLKELPFAIKELFGKLAETGLHYTKVFNQAQITVMFPLSSGMPFIYKYKEPTVIHMQAKVKGQSKFDRTSQSVGIKGEIQFTYARNIDGSVGFLNILSNNVSTVGFMNKVHLNIPIKVDIQMNKKELKMHVQPLQPEQDNVIFHYSVWPYSSIQKKDSLVPISLDPATKLITRAKKVVSLDDKNEAFLPRYHRYQVEGYSYSSDYRNVLRRFYSTNLLSNLIMAVYQRDVATTHFNLKYQGNNKPDAGATFTAAYDASYNSKETSQPQPFNATKIEDMSPNSPARRAKMIKRVFSGINNARAQVIDLSAAFGSDVFVFTAALANSPVDPKIQYAFFAGTNVDFGRGNQVNGVGKIIKPEAIGLNAKQSLEKKHNMNFEIDIKFGDQNNNMHIQGQAQRTEKYAEALKNLCADQMKRNNYYQNVCHNIVIMAQAPDYWNISVNFNGVEPVVWKTLFRAYNFVERYNGWYSDVMMPYPIVNDHFNIIIENNYLDNTMKVSLDSHEILRNVPIPRVAAHVLSTYQPIRPYERVANYYTDHQFQPFCAVDGDRIRTFSGRIYNYTLSPAWHVVMQDAPKKLPWQDELVVLSKKPNEQQQIVYISYHSETGDLEVEIEPTTSKLNVIVKTSSKKVSEGDLTIYWDDVEQKPFLQYYSLPDGVLVLNIREERFRVMYDGHRIVVLARDGRNTVRGLCGLMNGDIRDDYWTPQGLVDSDEQFGASYALMEGIDEKTQELQAQAQQMVYQRLHKYTNILKSDSFWQKWQSLDSTEGSWDDWSAQKIYRTRSHLKQPRGNCVRSKQVQYYETNSQICITTSPLDSCSSYCKGEGYKVQNAQVVCSSKTDVKFHEYVNQINQGKSPAVTGVTQTRQYRVPATCRM